MWDWKKRFRANTVASESPGLELAAYIPDLNSFQLWIRGTQAADLIHVDFSSGTLT